MAMNGGQRLQDLAKEYFELIKSNNPTFATSIGDRKYDDRLPDITLEGRNRQEGEYQSFLERAKQIIEQGLSEADRITRTALIVDLTTQIDVLASALDDWTVDPLRGPQIEFLNLESYQPVRTPDEGRMMALRWRAMGPYLHDNVKDLRRGLSKGKVAVRAGVEKVIDELEELLSKRDSDWALLRPLAVPHEDWSEAERKEFKEALTMAVKESIRPGFAVYLEFLKKDIVNKARPQDRPGVMHIPGGRDTYARMIRAYTSLNLTPEEFHQTGLNEVARINKEMEELGEKVFGTRDRKEILNRLRTDKSLYFSTRDEVFEKAEEALGKAKRAIPGWFGRLPKADCEVVRMGEHEEKHSTIAYYMIPSADGSRPGRYMINTSEPETRPRYEAEALAYHESIPGHHLQLAIAQELEGIPEFRKHGGVTAFIEGWGLYSERLSADMGLYSSDLDRVGVLSYDSWRACRLVVDTGMHAMGWTRDQAINYMFENSALAKNNIVNEVDRYITWPGQALAYKTGQLEMLRLRKKAKDRLLDSFDIKKFHDVLLGNGALPLEVLGQVVSESF
jgi:uncharacterized protein (DUF885 family)